MSDCDIEGRRKRSLDWAPIQKIENKDEDGSS